MKKPIKTMITMLLVLALLLSTIPVSVLAAPSSKEVKSKSYKAYMGIQTDTELWIFRSYYSDKKYGYGTDYFKGLYSESTKQEYAGTFDDVDINKDGTYTVSLTDPDLQNEKHISLLFVSTNIPYNKKIKISNVIVKFDGEEVYTYKKPFVDPETSNLIGIQCLNRWDKDMVDLFTYPIPFKKLEITFTITGLNKLKVKKHK